MKYAVKASNWKEALSKHLSCVDENRNPYDNSWLPDDIEDAKYEAFNADFTFDVKEI